MFLNNCVACGVSSKSLRRVLLKRHTTAAMEYQKPRCLWGFFWKIRAACLQSVTQQCWNIFKTALPVGFIIETWRSVLLKRDTTVSQEFQKLRCLWGFF
jgi:hypothetical protein